VCLVKGLGSGETSGTPVVDPSENHGNGKAGGCDENENAVDGIGDAEYAEGRVGDLYDQPGNNGVCGRNAEHATPP